MNKNLELLKQKVHKKIEKCIKKAERYYKMEFKYPYVKFCNLGNIGGCYIHRERVGLIEFNYHMLKENSKHFIDETVPHEVAHLIAFSIDPFCGVHGNLWKEVMDLYRIHPSLYHSYDTFSSFKFLKNKQIKTCSLCSKKFLFAESRHGVMIKEGGVVFRDGWFWHKKCKATIVI